MELTRKFAFRLHTYFVIGKCLRWSSLLLCLIADSHAFDVQEYMRHISLPRALNAYNMQS